MERNGKIILIMVGLCISLVFLHQEIRAADTGSTFLGDVMKAVKVLPWNDDPPTGEECTCPDHEKMCQGGMHGEMECVEGCPMDMMECGMMEDCHGGGSPILPSSIQRR